MNKYTFYWCILIPSYQRMYAEKSEGDFSKITECEKVRKTI